MAALALLVAGTAEAQTPPPPTTTPTTNLIQGLLNQLVSTTTTAPAAPATTRPPGAAAAPGAKPGAPAGPTTTTTTTTPPGVIPPEYLPIINSIHRTGSMTDAALIDALRPMQDLGYTAQEAALIGFGHFPVAGPADWNDDFLEPRFGPPFHLHQGNDIFAARGTPVRAPFSGVVRYEDGGLGGKAAYVTLPDHTFYYMAHLDSYNSKFPSGSAVKQGDVVGYTGDTGNAAGGPTHVHFEIHPGGGAAVNPKPILAAWMTEAINNAAALLPTNNANTPRALTGAGVLRRFEDQTSSPSTRAMGTLLWASSVSAGGGSIRVAELAVARLAEHIDWDHETTMAQAQADALRQGRTVAAAILGPLTPPVLLPIVRGGS